MDDRGRVDDDLDLLVREREQEVRLDQLQALVRERGAVDRDLRPHAPGRVRERFLRGDVLELVARAAAERAARRGQDERVYLFRGSAFEALERGGVLAVDRQQPPSAPLASGEREVTGGDEALLVREREVDAALERPDRDRQAREADDRVQDDVRLGAVEQLGQVAPGLRQRREPVDRRAARTRRRRARAPDARRRSRSPGGRSSPLRRSGRPASRRQYDLGHRFHSFLRSRRRPRVDFRVTIAAGRRLGPPERAKRDMAKPA